MNKISKKNISVIFFLLLIQSFSLDVFSAWGGRSISLFIASAFFILTDSKDEAYGPYDWDVVPNK